MAEELSFILDLCSPDHLFLLFRTKHHGVSPIYQSILCTLEDSNQPRAVALAEPLTGLSSVLLDSFPW